MSAKAVAGDSGKLKAAVLATQNDPEFKAGCIALDEP